MDITACVTDADLEAWRAVRMAVEPGERCYSVAELRAQANPSRLLVLARHDGTLVGSGLGDVSDAAGGGFVAPRVLEEHRRRGVGTALLRRLAEHCEGLGLPALHAQVGDDGGLAFAERFGFIEVDREIEQTLTIGDEQPPAPLPDGVEVLTLAERPELWERCYEGFGTEALSDFAVYAPLEISAEQWSTTWRGDPMFLAVVDGEVIGCAGLMLDGDVPERAENALTAVRRDWRGRGVAANLKRLTLHWAAGHGVREIYTWTQLGNVSMTRLNEHLGYVTTQTSVTVSRPLPLDSDR
jgi:mycothiol synthase